MIRIDRLFRKQALLFRARRHLGEPRPASLKTRDRRSGKSVPVVLQDEAADCGLACIAMLLRHRGATVALQALRLQFPASMKGTTVGDLVTIAAQVGLQLRPVRADVSDLEKLKLPAILHWDFNHYVVLEKPTGHGAVICDPGSGRVDVGAPALSSHYTGIALELEDGIDIPLPSGASFGFKELAAPLCGMRGSMMRIVAIALAVEACALTLPLYMKIAADRVGPELLASLRAIAPVFLGLVLVYASLSWLRTISLSKLSLRFNGHWLSRAYGHLLKLPYGFFQRRYVSDILYRFRAVRDIQATISLSVTESILDGIMSGITLFVLFAYNPSIAGITLSFLLAYATGKAMIARRQVVATSLLLQQQALQQSFLHETIKGILPIKMLSVEAQRFARWTNLVASADAREIEVRTLASTANAAKVALIGIDNIAVVSLGVHLLSANAWTTGTFFACYGFKMLFQYRAYSLVDRVADAYLVRPHLDQFADLILSEPEDASAGLDNADPVEELRGNALFFRYAPSDPWIIQDCSLHIASGETVAICGASGIGKSTLLKILAGLLPASDGHLSVNANQVSRSALSRYRSLVGAVLQEDSLVAGTIGENIGFGELMPDPARIAECAKQAMIFDHIATLPLGLDTPCGDAGNALSAGQRQRILLARALYKRPKILILDEATSNLDHENELGVFASLRNSKIIKIIVAHRAETLALADRVLRLDGGRLYESHLPYRPEAAEPPAAQAQASAPEQER